MTIILILLIIFTFATFYTAFSTIKKADMFSFDYFDPSTFYPDNMQQELKGPNGIFSSLFVLVNWGIVLSTVNLWQNLFNLMWVPIVAVLLDLISSVIETYWAYTNKTPLKGIIKGYYGKQFAYWYNIYTYSVFIISFILLIIYN